MDRRFVLFLVSVALVWGTFLGLRFLFAPPAPPVAEVQEDPAAELPAEDPAKPPGDPAEKPATDPNDPTTPPESPPPKTPLAAPQRLMLGSLDKAGQYRMLVTFTNQGAAVERVELNQYNDVEDQSGYLGHLALTDGPTAGAVVGIVGPGTPAALATCSDAAGRGLEPGDAITAIDGFKLPESATLLGWLTKNGLPGQTVALTVDRKGALKPLAYSAKLTRRPLEIVRPEPHEYQTETGKKFLPADPLSLLATLDAIGSKSLKPNQTELPGLPSLLTGNWTLDDQGADFVQFSYTLDEAALKAAGRTGSLKLVKRYTLAKAGDADKPGYHLGLRFEVHNLGTEPQSVAYRLQGPTGLPLEGWWYSTKLHPEWFKGAGARDVAWRVPNVRHQLMACPEIVSEAKTRLDEKLPPHIELLVGDNAQPLEYAGVDTQFFASALLPQKGAADEPIKFRRVEALPVQDVTLVPKNALKTVDVSVQLVSDLVKIEADKPLSHDYLVFFGPKDGDVLAAYQLDGFIEYGWTIFKYTALFLQGILAVLHQVTEQLRHLDHPADADRPLVHGADLAEAGQERGDDADAGPRNGRDQEEVSRRRDEAERRDAGAV